MPDISQIIMPFNQLQRRDSWPPTIIRIDLDESAHEVYLDDPYDPIDEDPFSHFLTPPDDVEDADDADFEDLSAGIESSKSASPPVRAISPSSLEQIIEEEEQGHGVKLPLALKDFSKLHSAKKEEAVGLGIDMPELMATRGRSRVRTPSRVGGGRGRGQTRSLPGRRTPHSWRVPSPDVWSIEEEGEAEPEGNTAGDEIMAAQKHVEGFDTRVEGVKAVKRTPSPMLSESPKPKKRVHWAF